MAKEDKDAVAVLVPRMQSEGVTFIDHCTIDEVTHSSTAGFTLKYRRKQDSEQSLLEVDAVLVAAGVAHL